VSRYERGVTPLTDVAVLRRFARALAIPPGELGLAAAPSLRAAARPGRCGEWRAVAGGVVYGCW
jgi:hypothetical protein